MTISADNTHAKLLATLRNLAPSKVRAYTSDDEFRDIAVPTRRRKWAQVITAIDARAWSRVELLDKSGGVLGYVENTDAPTEVEELSVVATPRVRHDAEWIVQLAMKAQRDALASRDSEVKALLTAQGDVVREMAAAMQSLSGIWREQREAASEVAAMRATAAAGDGGGSFKELLDAAPQILQALPMLKALLAGGSPATPNGAKKAPGS